MSVAHSVALPDAYSTRTAYGGTCVTFPLTWHSLVQRRQGERHLVHSPPSTSVALLPAWQALHVGTCLVHHPLGVQRVRSQHLGGVRLLDSHRCVLS